MSRLGANLDLRNLEDGLAEEAQLISAFLEFAARQIPALSYSYRRISEFLQQNIDLSSTIAHSSSHY